VGEDVPDQDAVFTVLTECRPVARDWFVEHQVASFDLLPQRDRGERFGSGEEREERFCIHKFATLRVGVSLGEVQDELATAIDRQRRAREEPQGAELLPEKALDLVQCSCRNVMLTAGRRRDSVHHGDHRGLLSDQNRV
jgi:hypothetical protein